MCVLISGGSATQLIKVMGVSLSLYFTCLGLAHQKMTLSLARGRGEGISTTINIFFQSLPQEIGGRWKIEGHVSATTAKFSVVFWQLQGTEYTQN